MKQMCAICGPRADVSSPRMLRMAALRRGARRLIGGLACCAAPQDESRLSASGTRNRDGTTYDRRHHRQMPRRIPPGLTPCDKGGSCGVPG